MANEKLIPLSEVKKKLTAIRQYFSGYPSTDQDKLARSVVKLCMEEVGKIKPVDAVEVVHGRWVKKWHGNDLIGHEYEECSVCGSCIISDTEKFWDCNYCPNCGAKMDGKEN